MIEKVFYNLCPITYQLKKQNYNISINQNQQWSRAPTRCSHHISETISSPFRGAFHLSLTVLSAIDLHICLALEGGPPRFGPDFTCPTLLRNPHPCSCVSTTGLSPCFADRSRSFVYTSTIGTRGPTTPRLRRVWADAFSLATTKAISKFDFFSPATEMFQFAEYTSRPRLRLRIGM